jgi:hypothetical protein
MSFSARPGENFAESGDRVLDFLGKIHDNNSVGSAG